MAAKKAEQETTTETERKSYILTLKNGDLRRIQVPENWKVTFGPLLPGNRHDQGGLCLRFYEAKDLQRAIFTDVTSFRDESIPIEEKVTRTQRQTMKKRTPEGVKDVIVEAKVSTWRNPDDTHMPDDDLLSLPSPDPDDGIPF